VFCVDGMEAEQLERFEEEIGMRVNPEDEAKKALKAFQEAQGMVIENPDAPVGPDAKALAWMKDEEIPGSWMGGT
jgi:hypothetical protein